MKKDEIISALKTISVPGEGQNMVESGAVTNVQVFGDEVEVDITINNPSLQAKNTHTHTHTYTCIYMYNLYVFVCTYFYIH